GETPSQTQAPHPQNEPDPNMPPQAAQQWQGQPPPAPHGPRWEGPSPTYEHQASPGRIPAERPPQPSTNRPPPPPTAPPTTPAPPIPALPPTPPRPAGTRRGPAPRRVRRPRGPAAVPDALPAGPPVRLPEPLSTCLPAARLRPARTAGRPPQPFRPTGSAHRC